MRTFMLCQIILGCVYPPVMQRLQIDLQTLTITYYAHFMRLPLRDWGQVLVGGYGAVGQREKDMNQMSLQMKFYQDIVTKKERSLKQS